MKDINGQHDDLIVSNAGRMVDAAVNFFLGSGVAAAYAREAIKDIHNTYMEVFFGRGDRGSEPGTPLTPLFHDIVEARKSYGSLHDGGPQAEVSMSKPSITESILNNPQQYLSPQ